MAMRLSRMFRADEEAAPDEGVSVRRMLFWTVVWIALLIGIVLYFRHAHFLTPLLA